VTTLFESVLTLPNFIVLEGIDGAGTTTQLDLLDERLTARSIPHFTTCEPTSNRVGELIRSVLSGKVRVAPETLAYLFAADRNEHVFDPDLGIIAKHDAAKVIVSDRYLFSSLAYQSIECDVDFIARLNERFPLPGHLFFIDIPIEVCMERLAQREAKDIFEKKGFQEKVIASYKRTLGLFDGTQMKIHIIDGTLSKEDVSQKIWEITASLPILK
jgi:dTMP kinase